MSQSSISSVDFGPVAVSDAVYSYVTSSMQAALMALCLYDHFLTLDREVACIWKRKLSIASWLFLVNRYATLCCNMIAAVEMVVWNPQERRTADQICNITGRAMDACTIMIHIVFALFAAIRTYAVWGRNFKVFLYIFVPGLIYPAGYLYRSTQSVYSAYFPSPLTGCAVVDSLPADLTPSFGIDNLFFILAGVSTLLFECITIALTWTKTIPAVRHLRRTNTVTGGDNKLALSYVIFHDGTLQFIVILILNCICLLELAWGPLSYLFNLSDVLTSIIISRFILDLREDYITRSQHSGEGSHHVSDISSVRFGSVVPSDLDGSVGSSSSATLQVQSTGIAGSLGSSC